MKNIRHKVNPNISFYTNINMDENKRDSIYNKHTILNELDELIEDMDGLTYLTYKINRDKYKKVLSETDFDKIDKYIDNMKVFFMDLDKTNHEDVYKLIKLLHNMSNVVEYNDDIYIKTINRIYDESQKNILFKSKFEDVPYIYYDLIYNFNKYPINLEDDIINIHNIIDEIYHETDIDKLFTYGIDTFYLKELDKDLEYVKIRDLVYDHDLGEKMLDDDDYFKYLKIMRKKKEDAKNIADEKKIIEREKIRRQRIERNSKIMKKHVNIEDIISDYKDNITTDIDMHKKIT